MKITDMKLTEIEQKRNVLLIQSTYPDIAYAIDRFNKVMWVINRRTGEQMEIDVENVYAFAFEMMDIADLFLKNKTLFKVG